MLPDLPRMANCADDATTENVDYSTGMRLAVDRQNKSLGETISAIGEIMTTIQNMAAIAQEILKLNDELRSNTESVQAELLQAELLQAELLQNDALIQ